MKKFSTFCLSLILALLCVLIFSTKAHAATFTVTDNGDASAVDPSVSCDTAGSVCTLRSAIEAANAQAGADTISFNISGPGEHTISPATALPDITDEVTIDGSTQPGAQCGTLVPVNLPQSSNTPHTLYIVINVGGLAGSSALHFTTGSTNSTVRGLVMNGTTSNAAALAIDSTVGGMLVECNYIGTNFDGSSANSGAGAIGIRAFVNNPGTVIQNNLISGNETGIIPNGVTIQNNLIGTNSNGTGAIANTVDGIDMVGAQDVIVDHNIISGNVLGVNIDGNGFNVSIVGNYIGLGVTGNPLGNTGTGIRAFGASNFSIGGTSLSQRNVVSANSEDGIHIYKNCNSGNPTSANSTIFNNYIGTKADGVVENGYGNGATGIEVNEYYGGCVSVYKHQIGGDEAGQANVIAGNTNQGILIHQSSGYDVFSITAFGNSIYANGQFGIDLAADSDGNNGVADTDLGPNVINAFLMSYPTTNANYYINHPVINSTSFSGNQLTVNYNFQANGVEDNLPYISSEDVVGYRLDFYLNDNAQDGAYTGYNQGKIHLGSFIVNGSETNATHTFTSPVTLTGNQSVNTTTTVLWTTSPDGGRSGDGPPYSPPK